MPGDSFNQLELFADLDKHHRSLVRPLFTSSNAYAGTVLFEQGDRAKKFFIIVDGEVHVHYKPEDGPALIVARVRSESMVGWSAVLGNPNYTSSAVCHTDCRLLQMSGEDLRELCTSHPDICPVILDKLAIMIAERLRNTHGHIVGLLRESLQIRINNSIPAEQIK